MNNPSRKKKFLNIKVTEETKGIAEAFSSSIAPGEFDSPVTYDHIVSYFCENATDEDRKRIILKALSWSHEKKRLRHLWEQENEPITEKTWDEMMERGQVASFLRKHSRLKIGEVKTSA